ncbi:MAG TPA: ubiquinol-cytochrome C chaperone family protein [Rhizomicrobium sp.]|nr:ubiquinol-cytochrome C chaperone family protein [Rhizomicrobium sp.]
MLNLLGKSAARRELGGLLEEQLSARARAPFFYRELGVPDTMDGRFDMVALHAWAALKHLKATGQDEAAQLLTDALFLGFDEALREQGVSDIGMGRRMKAIANAFYGRLAAYDRADGRDAMAAALAFNVWRGQGLGQPAGENARALARYVETMRAALTRSQANRLEFGALP